MKTCTVKAKLKNGKVILENATIDVADFGFEIVTEDLFCIGDASEVKEIIIKFN